MDGEWITAARAYEIVSSAAPLRAAITICSRANDGLVRARAKRLVWGSGTSNDAEVPSEFWWARGQTALHQNWASGDFETWIEQRIHCRAYGVHFHADDINDMVPTRQRTRTELSRRPPGNFAPALKCRGELQEALGCSEKDAEKIILEGCRAELVSSRCSSITWRVKDRYGTNRYKDLNVEVPNWFWDHCLNSSDTVLIWSGGRFAGKGYVDSEEYKAVVSGVEFQVSDIVQLEGAHRRETNPTAMSLLPVETAKPDTGRGGRRRSDQWRPWIAELVAYVHDHGFPEGYGAQGQEQLIKAVADALAERGEETLSRSAVQPVVQAVLDRLRAASN